MTYRISNNSHQEGMVSLDGQWVTVNPGEVKYSETFPGARTQNLIVKKVVTTDSSVEYQQPKPASGSRVLVQKEVANLAVKEAAAEGKKEDK